MKTRNTKEKAADKPKTLTGKRKTSGKHTAAGVPAKKIKPTGKASTKSIQKEIKSSVLKKTSKPRKAGKDLGADSSGASKKTSAKKSLKSAQAKLKKVKEKITKPKKLTKKTDKKASKGTLKKIPSSSKATSRRATKKVVKEIKKAETPKTKKATVRGIKLPWSKKRLEMITKLETGPERKKAPLPKSKEALDHMPLMELPKEYGENELILIAVDQNMVFVDWEITPKEASRAIDGFTMRVYDVTAQEPQRLPKESLVDIKLKDRVGRAFFELGLPGRQVAIEIGVYEKGKFLPILRSWAVSMPRMLSVDELGIALKLFESGISVGY